MYEFTGVVKRIGEVQTFSGGFSKRGPFCNSGQKVRC